LQRPNEAKRQEIMRVAARMFAARPFHQVKLDAIASRARIGKGTIYVYFTSKDDLYLTLIADGIDQLVAELRSGRGRDVKAWPALERVTRALLGFADRFPHLYTLMRAGMPPRESHLISKRTELVHELVRILRAGVRAGELDDPHPELTAEFLLSFVRSALLFAPARMSRPAITRHILRVLGRGILRKATR
jgi:AcrR family transcriptional regulator